MKFSVYTLSLPDMTPTQAAALIASQGLQGVEWRLSELPQAYASEPFSFSRNNACTVGMSPTDGQYLAGVASRAQLTSIGVAPYIRIGDADGFERAAVVASCAGAKTVRVRAPVMDGTSVHELLRKGRKFLEVISDVAREYHVAAALEIHQGSVCPSASLAERLVAGLDAAVIKVIYDVGNLVLEGYEDHRIGLDILGEHLSHIHLKNAWWERSSDRPGTWVPSWSPLDDGVLDARRFLDLLAERDYQGWVSLEDLSTARSPTATLVYNAALLRQWGFLGPAPAEPQVANSACS